MHGGVRGWSRKASPYLELLNPRDFAERRIHGRPDPHTHSSQKKEINQGTLTLAEQSVSENPAHETVISEMVGQAVSKMMQFCRNVSLAAFEQSSTDNEDDVSQKDDKGTPLIKMVQSEPS